MNVLGQNTNVKWSPGEVEGVMIGQAREDGPTVGIIGGVHGDEGAGIEIVRGLPATLNLKRGKVIAMTANLKAVAKGTRQFQANLNRSFRPLSIDEQLRNPSDLPYETLRAQELMDYIKQCEAILDLHEYEDPNGMPFVICERDSLAIAQRIGPAAVAFGFSKSEPGGSDAYGHTQGVQAICYELGVQDGQHQRQNVHFGQQVLARFLAAEGLTDSELEPFHKPLLVEAVSAPIRTGTDFSLAPNIVKSFQVLTPGQLVAADGGRTFYADPDRPQVILFPKTDPQAESEAFVLANVVKS